MLCPLAAGQPDLSRVPLSIICRHLVSVLLQLVTRELKDRNHWLHSLSKTRGMTPFLLCSAGGTGLGRVGDSVAGAGPLALRAGLAQGAQPSPGGTEARGGEGWAGDRVAVLLPLCVCSHCTFIVWGWLPSAGCSVPSTAACLGCVSTQPGPCVSAGAGLLETWGWWQHWRRASPWRAAPRLLDGSGCVGLRPEERRDGAGDSRLAHGLLARDWMGVRWRPGKLCEPVFRGGKGERPSSQEGRGQPTWSCPGPQVSYQGAQLQVWWVEARPRTDGVMVWSFVSGNCLQCSQSKRLDKLFLRSEPSAFVDGTEFSIRSRVCVLRSAAADADCPSRTPWGLSSLSNS